MSLAYHPQMDGQSKVLNKCLELYLWCFCFKNAKAWTKYLVWAEYWYNTSYQTSLGVTPFEAVYGRQSPKLVRYLPELSNSPSIPDLLKERDNLLQRLRVHLQHAQKPNEEVCRLKKDRHGILDWRLGICQISAISIELSSTEEKPKVKHEVLWSFPYCGEISSVAYKLQLPQNTRIHLVFQISILKKCVGEPQQQHVPLPLLTNEEGPLVQPKVVLGTR